jgi:hypothetical protein
MLTCGSVGEVLFPLNHEADYVHTCERFNLVFFIIARFRIINILNAYSAYNNNQFNGIPLSWFLISIELCFPGFLFL